jgi:probable F420-dependent oxidoreductase
MPFIRYNLRSRVGNAIREATMEFGITAPSRGALARPEPLARIVREAEALGYGYVCVADHVVVPRRVSSTYPYSDDGAWPAGKAAEFMEPLSVLAFLAGQTERIRLLTSVMVLPHRPPVLTAKMLATIDVLSNGRVTVGAGAGWLKEEFEAIGAPPHGARGKVADEYIRIFRELWTADDPRYEGDFASVADVWFEPKPVQKPHPPIWIGGESDAAMKRVVRVGDGWYPIGHNPRFPLDTVGRFRAALDRLHGFASAAGRNAAEIELGYYLPRWGSDSQAPQAAFDSPDATGDNRRILTGSLEQVATDLQALRDLGVKTLNLNFNRDDLDATIRNMSAFARDIMPLAR